MATQTITDAVVVPQDPGTGIDNADDVLSAGVAALLARYEEGTYVDEGLAFANIDAANDEVDVTSGIAFIEDDLSSTTSERGSGGRAQIQSTRVSGYDTEIPADQAYLVIVPTDQTDLGLDADAENDVYLSVDPTAQNSATLHFGSSINAPSDPSIELGTVDSSDGSVVARPSDDAAVTRRSMTAVEGAITGETFVRATRDTETNSISSGTRTSIFDGASKDVRDEYSGSSFTPDKDGEYVVMGIVRLGGSTAAGNTIQVRVRDTAAGVNPNNGLAEFDCPDSSPFLNFVIPVELEAGNNYQIQVTNIDSSFTVTKNSEGVIKRSVVHD